MSIRRRTTVHDLAALRLHPDGSRVQNAPSGVRPRTAKALARDRRDNWIAQDAGGRGTVKQRDSRGKQRAKGPAKDGGDDCGEVFVLDSDDRISVREPGDSAEVGSGGEGSGLEKDGLKDPRSRKRRKFYHDFDYLTAADSPLTFSSQKAVDADVRQPLLPPPSSDFLKCVHHFASEFYAGRDQLFDAAREARKEKKARKLQAGPATSPAPEDVESRSSTGENGKKDRSSRSQEDNEMKLSGDTGRRRQKNMKKQDRYKTLRRDMYEAFEGSALMAIGMLLQEHVVSLMSEAVPEEWEEQMEAYEEIRLDPHQSRNKSRGSNKRRLAVEDEETAGASEAPALNATVADQSSHRGDTVSASESSDLEDGQ